MALLFFFSSCQRDHILAPDPSPEAIVETRCCDDLTGDIYNDPLYQEAWDNLYIGLIDPSLNIIEAMDTAYINAVVEQFESCLLSGQPPEVCADNFIEAFSVESVIKSLDLSLFDSLRYEYADIPDEEYFASLEEAFLASMKDLVDDHRLPCFQQYQTKIRNISMGGLAKLATTNSGVVAGVAALSTIIQLAMARHEFCFCLYNNYGYGC